MNSCYNELMKVKLTNIKSIYLRSFIFGSEDSVVSTVGLLTGVALSGVEGSIIILTGTILVFVEAFSMGVGMYLSESSVEEYEARASVKVGASIFSGIITFFSYCITGFVVMLPYFFTNSHWAVISSILISFVFLAILGLVSAKLSHISKIKKVLNMVIVGGLAILIGVVVGQMITR
ncbi:MAG: VIT1/CCC1 transporter family protein [Saprospiraceae bacterium]|nr:VIT1/CCC1 transporter family protein [Saprospiraceae bacterium]